MEQVISVSNKTNMLLESMLTKHQAISQHQGKIGAKVYCVGCKSPTGTLTTEWPCDVIILATQVIEEIVSWLTPKKPKEVNGNAT